MHYIAIFDVPACVLQLFGYDGTEEVPEFGDLLYFDPEFYPTDGDHPLPTWFSVDSVPCESIDKDGNLRRNHGCNLVFKALKHSFHIWLPHVEFVPSHPRS